MRHALPFLAVLSALAQPSADSFETRVRPVLVKNCLACHGAEKQFAGLRLDSREALLTGGKRGPAISAGAPARSLIVRAMRHQDGIAMPMGAPKLSERDIAEIEEWIRQGAVWPVSANPEPSGWYERAARTHWSFQPVKKHAPPAVRQSAWPRNDVDRFLLAALEAKGLAPAPPADPLTLIRRASLLLTGLPPTPAGIAAFAADTSPGAFERAVDRLLASPHFGEHWARHWMDVVRYGETRGYEWNYEIVGAWRYRDYLIRAFNADVPYDQFVREHIAGDLLAKPRINVRDGVNESIIGPTFFRLGEAGHDDCVQFREISLDVVDNQIDTLGKAFQGLTLACARCHDHKLDPIPTRDYYGLFGILNSSRAMTHTIDLPASLVRERDSLAGAKNAIQSELVRIWLAQLPALRPAVKKAGFHDPLFPWLAMRGVEPERFAEIWASLAARYRDETETRAKFNRESFTPYTGWRDWFQDGLGLSAASAGSFTVATEGGHALTAIVPAGLHTNLLTDRWNGALRSPRLPKTHKYLSVRLMGGRLAASRTVLDNCAIGEGYRTLDNDSPRWFRLDTYSKEKLPAFAEIITKRDNPRIPDRPGVIKAGAAELASPHSYFGAISTPVLHDTPELPREELSHMTRLFDGPPVTSEEDLTRRYRDLLRHAIEQWTGKPSDDDVRWLDAFLRAGLLENNWDASPSLRDSVRRYRETEAQLPEPRVVDGIGDAGAGFDTPILRTGDPHLPGDTATRGFLSRIGSETAPFATQGSGRLELAGIIASKDNTLTARVMVNRVWHHLFGRGLVPTVDNFGQEGESPSHPELLDYLAAHFIGDGWSVKKLARLLVTSEAFRQSGAGAAAAMEADPQNTLLHRFTARRLPAESLRDTILATSGRLNRTLYGPSIPPPRNEPQDYRRLFNGPLDGRGRRSIYTQITRMEGSRFLEIFDYPNPMAARGARDITNVPAQALAMMNDPFVYDQARIWAERLIQQDKGAVNAAQRVDTMFRAALGRPPSEAERQRFAALAAELASFHANATRESLLTNAAVWQDVAHAIFNLKEFLYVR